MTKTYDYKSLVKIYVSIPREDWIHKDFRTYREALVAKLEELFGISINPEKRPYNPDVFVYGGIHAFTLWKLFETTVHHLRGTGVTGHWLEGGPISSLYQIEETHPSDNITATKNSAIQLQNLENTMDNLRYELLYELIELFYGKIDKVVTSAELLAAGFDDSTEPQSKDYYNYI